MALKQDVALKRAQEILDTSASARACHEALCGLWLCYTYGSQWAKTRRGGRGGTALEHMRTIISPNRSDVRMAMNLIRPRVIKQNSRLKPKMLRYSVQSDSGAPNDVMAALVGDKLMNKELLQMEALRALRKASLWRVVIGSCVVRRTMKATGDPIVVRDPNGAPIKGSNGQPKTIRSWEHGVAVCPPFEFCRDPAANDVSFAGEDSIGHEKPVPLRWVQRNFSHMKEVANMEAGSTMGQLLDYQRFLYQAVGQSLARGWRESKTPAVMFGEWWFRDDEADAKRRWPWYMITVRNTKGENPSDRMLRPLMFGPNPFYRLPLHHYWFNDELLQPWGRGVPSACYHAQNAVNLAFMNSLRALVMHGNIKYLVEQNSLADEIGDALTNRFDVPIVYVRGSTPPKRMDPGHMDPQTAQILQSAPQWLDWMLNMSPVQGGEAVKRGEASKAYEFRLQQADTPLTSISDEDELTDNKLLTGLLHDLMRTQTVKGLKEKLSGDFTMDQLASFIQQDPERSELGVFVNPDSVRPKTPQEHKDEAKEAIESQLLDPTEARLSLLSRARIALSHREQAAFDKQQQENQMLLAGEPVTVYLQQDHDIHQYALSLLSEMPRWDSLTNEQKFAITSHWREHQDKKEMRLGLDAQTQAAAQGQQAPEQGGGEMGQMGPGMAGGAEEMGMPPTEGAMPQDQLLAPGPGIGAAPGMGESAAASVAAPVMGPGI